MPTLDKTIAHLIQLQAICVEGRRTFRLLASGAQDALLREFLGERERNYSALIVCLRTQITTYGGRANWHVSLAVLWQRSWYRLRSLIAPTDDRTRLEVASRLETRSRRAFESLLAQTLSPAFQQQLAEHHQHTIAAAQQLQNALDHWPCLDTLKREHDRESYLIHPCTNGGRGLNGSVEHKA